MKAFPQLASQLLALTLLSAVKLAAAPEAIEIGPHNVRLLPGGKEADGIIGDFILRNNKVEAVISGNLPLRRANMSTFYGANGVTPGCLYDLSLRGANNDQLTIFAPVGQSGMVSHVRILKDGKQGEASIETLTTGVTSTNRIYKRHDYLLRDDWLGVLVITTLRNDGNIAITGQLDDRATTFTKSGNANGIQWYDAVDPADKAGYAFAWVEFEGIKLPPTELNLKSGQSIQFARFVAVGRSPAEAVGIVAAWRGATGTLSGRISDSKGAAIGTAKIELNLAGKKLVAYPDATGNFSIKLPPGEMAVEVRDIGREPKTIPLTIVADKTTTLNTELGNATAVEFDIRDAAGKSTPCKAQFIGINGTPSPDLGPNNRAHGCLDQYHSAVGQFRVQIPAGDYRIVVTRGTEHSHITKEVRATATQPVVIKGTLARLVDSRGWVSTDFHNHSTPSGDNTCGTDDRIINLAAEHIEFAPTTEHNRIYDWTPHIRRLGLTNHLSTVIGMELTGSGMHMNSFPMKPVPRTQDNGAPIWNSDPRITALTLRGFQGNTPDRWIHSNHPDMIENFVDRDGDGKADGGFAGLGGMLDAMEAQNYSASQILSKAPYGIQRDRVTGRDRSYAIREFVWLQLLNRGHRLWGIAVCDAHTVHGNGVGGWRTYVRSSTDNPPQIDWQEISRNSKAGQMILSTGPFMEVSTSDGTIAGGITRSNGNVALRVRVQCTDWIDIDRVQVLVNGRQEPSLNFTRAANPAWFQNGTVKFDQTIKVPLQEDAHLIVVALGENFDLKTGYGSSSQASIKPIAYNNPIFVDIDGNGFRPNGDTLGHPLPVKRSIESVREIIGVAPAPTVPVAPKKTK